MPTGTINGTNYHKIAQIAAVLPSIRDHDLQKAPPQVKHVAAANNSSDAEGISARAGALKVLIAGDSMTQGQEGDYTWRYRMYQWFQSQNVAVDFVGPYKGTRQPPVTAPPSPPALTDAKKEDQDVIADGGYAAGVNFDSDHFSIWAKPVQGMLV